MTDNSPIVLEDGKNYIIDKDYNNGGVITLIEHGNLYCKVKDPDTNNTWITMTSRLSPVE